MKNDYKCKLSESAKPNASKFRKYWFSLRFTQSTHLNYLYGSWAKMFHESRKTKKAKARRGNQYLNLDLD